VSGPGVDIRAPRALRSVRRSHGPIRRHRLRDGAHRFDPRGRSLIRRSASMLLPTPPSRCRRIRSCDKIARRRPTPPPKMETR